MTSFFKTFLLLDLLLAGFYLLTGDLSGMLNSQVGAISALAVAVGSFMGYRQSIKEQVEKLEGLQDDDRDELDAIDDPHELFDEEPINEKELSNEEVKQIFAEEKAKVKQQSNVKNLFLSFKGIFSPFRLIGYGVLLFGFFWLEGNGKLVILPYLLGLSLLPFSSVVMAFTGKSRG